MKKEFISFLLVIGFSYLTNAQVKLKILSETKQIFISQGILERISMDKYREKILLLQNTLRDVVKLELKSVTGQTTRDENIQLRLFPFNGSISDYEGKLRFDFKLPYNSIEVRITTPDKVLGIGKDRKYDPLVTIVFDVMVSVPIEQQGTSESISFLSPLWGIKIRSYNFSNYDDNSVEKLKVQTWIEGGNMGNAIRKVFYSMDDLRDVLNNYLSANIKNNPNLLKEMAIDETRDLDVLKSGDSTLVFSHKQSQKGLVKRNSTDEASKITEEVKTVTPPPSNIPTSNSPAGASNGASSTNSGSKLPTSNSPSDANKGPSSTPKVNKVIKKYQ